MVNGIIVELINFHSGTVKVLKKEEE